MKRIQIYLLRLIIPLMFLISFAITKSEFMKAFAIGYLFCWVFGIHYALAVENEK
jgi:hypothetical protein